MSWANYTPPPVFGVMPEDTDDWVWYVYSVVLESEVGQIASDHWDYLTEVRPPLRDTCELGNLCRERRENEMYELIWVLWEEFEESRILDLEYMEMEV